MKLILKILILTFINPINIVLSQAKYIKNAEYSIDSDPGKGNANKINSIDGSFDGNTETVKILIPTAELDLGKHFVYIRMKNSEGEWGIKKFGIFVIKPSSDRVISNGEYFLDTDPGRAMGVPIYSDDGPIDESSESFKKIITTAGLSLGNHVFGLRLQDSDGNWGPLISAGFRITDKPVTPPEYVAKAEYYIDDDPSVGNGKTLYAIDGAFDSPSEKIRGNIKTANISLGYHWLYTRIIDNTGRWSKPDSCLINIKEPSSINYDSTVISPTEFRVINNYPNPFNSYTTIRYELPRSSFISIIIFNLNGKVIKEIYNGIQPAGWYSVKWDGTNKNGDSVSSGIYFFKIKTSRYLDTKSMLLLR